MIDRKRFRRLLWACLPAALAFSALLFSPALLYWLEGPWYALRFIVRDHTAKVSGKPLRNYAAIAERQDPGAEYLSRAQTAMFLDAARAAKGRAVYVFDDVAKAGGPPVLTGAEWVQNYNEDIARLYAESDRRLITAARKMGGVYLPLSLRRHLERPEDVTAAQLEEKKAMASFIAAAAIEGAGSSAIGRAQSFDAEFAELLSAAKGVGADLLDGSYAQDGIGIPLFFPFRENQYLLSNTLLLALDYYGLKKSAVSIEPKKRVVIAFPKSRNQAPVVIPVDDRGMMKINYPSGDFSLARTALAKNNLLAAGVERLGAHIEAQDASGAPILVDEAKVRRRDAKTLAQLGNKIIFYGRGHTVAFPLQDKSMGVYLASAFNTIAQQRFLKDAPKLAVAAAVFAVAFLAALFSRLGGKTATLSMLALIVFIAAANLFLFARYSLIVPAMPLFLAALASGFAASASNLRMLAQEKKRINSLFSGFIGPNVAAALSKKQNALNTGGETRDLTVFFSDVRNFTNMSEQIGDPALLVDRMNEYFAAMTYIVFEENGTLDKYIGDAVMAFWGAPLPQEDHALRACRAACRQLRLLRLGMQPQWLLEGRPLIDIGIGLNSGAMVVGNVGGSNRVNYTLMGDNVNIGSRLESATKEAKASILISEETYKRAQNKLAAKKLPAIKVKGKSQPISVYALEAILGEEKTTSFAKGKEQIAWEKQAEAAIGKGEPLPAMPAELALQVKRVRGEFKKALKP